MFVSFEGADGSGKSTQAELLSETLAAEAHEVVLTREPGGTELGERARELVLNGPEMGAWAEAALYAASRAEHVEEVIRPALERGATVLCDRYIDSSLAYQGVARGLGVDAAYRSLAARFPERIVTVNADRAPAEIGSEIREQFRQRS